MTKVTCRLHLQTSHLATSSMEAAYLFRGGRTGRVVPRSARCAHRLYCCEPRGQDWRASGANALMCVLVSYVERSASGLVLRKTFVDIFMPSRAKKRPPTTPIPLDSKAVFTPSMNST